MVLNWLWAGAASTIVVTILTITALLLVLRSGRSRHKLPPGPIQWPIMGSLLSVGFEHRYRTFAKLAKSYGPLLYVRLGMVDTIVVSSPELAKDVLKIHDAQWSSRPYCAAGKYIGFDFHSLDFAPNGPHWRHLRKLCVAELFSPTRLNMHGGIRREEVLHMVGWLAEACQTGEAINVRNVCDNVIGNIICRMLFGKNYYSANDPVSQEMQSFMADVREAMVLIGALALADIIPALDRFDLQGYNKRFKTISQRLERMYKLIIEDHEQGKKNGQTDKHTKDFIDVLLSLEGDSKLSEKSLMGLMTDVLLFGIDITPTAIEWVMTELIRNPQVLRKAQKEIDSVVGKERLVEESDLQNLPYLQAIVKETLRLHPPVPVTDPHYNEVPVELGGYQIPPGFVMFVNIWALGRDETLWKHPLEFLPERFLESEINVHGNHFQLLPFSSGRRKCPAAGMALLKTHHTVAVLIHAFDWAPPQEQNPQDINIDEGVGVIAFKKIPLLANAKSRLPEEVIKAR
ncbi:hypothetical protein O6H91_16G078300 [Diphasiastrum complanatum]|uniref:Uncharacterized protein n=1 Tax=Diphasiastrum complanatum TaxID=34168 RepID=A0ACC2BDV7_DIPCM|nr:hypothetical protein O6H91_16G078300 [Diphasiastrum complanatum]